MLSFCSLGSGSKGNLFLLRTERNRIAIDAGLQTLDDYHARLAERNLSQGMDCLVVSHSHQDHVNIAVPLAKLEGVPIVISEQSLNEPGGKRILNAMNTGRPADRVEVITFNPGDSIVLTKRGLVQVESKLTAYQQEHSDLILDTFEIPHDVVNVGFRIRHNDVKTDPPRTKQIFYATDLGQITAKVRDMAEGVDVLIIESNYDTECLWTRTPGTYNDALKDRIDSDRGHLSNHQVGELLQYLNTADRAKALQLIIAAHVGNKSNREHRLRRTFMEWWAKGKDRRDLPIIEKFSRRMSSRIYALNGEGVKIYESRYNK